MGAVVTRLRQGAQDHLLFHFPQRLDGGQIDPLPLRSGPRLPDDPRKLLDGDELPPAMITERSTTFSSSRTLPGQL